ncbi:MAG TPA: hypothetical protein VNH83_09890, partial [Bryobacteraceae bacterium]|nr:hypothetical protein [Bryobacteraceae bacterium]
EQLEHVSAPHDARRIDIERLEEMVKPQQERESNGHLRRRHGKNKQKHHLTVGVTPTRSSSNECQSGRVEHYLN